MTKITDHSFEAVVEACHTDTPSFCIVPTAVVDLFKETETFVVRLVLNNSIDLGRRSIKPWGDGRWFTEFTKKHCQTAGIKPGDTILCQVTSVPDTPPDLLRTLKKTGLDTRWNQLTRAQRRSFSEEIFAAKTAATQTARIEKVVTCLNGL